MGIAPYHARSCFAFTVPPTWTIVEFFCRHTATLNARSDNIFDIFQEEHLLDMQDYVVDLEDAALACDLN